MLKDTDGQASFEKKEILNYVSQSGKTLQFECYRRVVALSDFECGLEIKAQCEGCPNHGRNFSCPPYSPFFLDYRGNAHRVLVICIRLSKEYFDGATSQEKYHQCFKEAGHILRDELYEYQKTGKTIAGSGPCLACKKCAWETGSDECRYPEKRIYSLESLGVNVISLLKNAFDLDLEWDSNGEIASYVCAVGAVFL
jgi:predicted metal-binding protein